MKTKVVFKNNSATSTGGGIYVKSSVNIDSFTVSSCFYELLGITYDEFNDSVIRMTMHFINNTGVNGGNDIYGATPNSYCKIQFVNITNKSSEIYHHIFRLSNLSPISSDPKRVCLRDTSSKVMCADLSYIYHSTTRYPGEVFSLSLAVVGLDFGIVTGPVYAYLLPQTNNTSSSLGEGESVRQIMARSSNTNLDFVVNSHNPREIIVLSTNSIKVTEAVSKEDISKLIPVHKNPVPSALLTALVYINVTLLDCPPGFQINGDGACECNKTLKDIGIVVCVIYNNISFVNRSGNQWIQQLSNSSIIASKYCPFNYCNQTAMQLNLKDPDKQCALNHTGILCGACPSNLSLAIGSSKCLECHDDYHILLLIAFAAVGVLLVLFISVLNVTVAMGTISGLIFYSNIVWANQSVLFPPQDETSFLLHFLKTFIAWLNLDVGIESCFIQGLDGFWKTWLQFVFPAYIWLIAGLIILASHYSIRVTRILGDNSVSVLATLFLLSYAKLLRTIIIVLEFTVLEYPDGLHIVWSFDGNILYFGLKHSILFVVAVIILLVLWLPYTFTLLFIQCLRRYSHLYGLRWVNKLTPFFDSYTGPLKDKHHYWIGLGLFARLVLLLTSTVTLITMPYVAALIVTLSASMLGMLVISVYKEWWLGLLEGAFLINLALFSSGALLVEAQQGNKEALACTSLTIAFILFLAIISYHLWKKCICFKGKRILNENRNGYEDIDNIQAPPEDLPPRQQSTTYQEVSVPALRESLLESI